LIFVKLTTTNFVDHHLSEYNTSSKALNLKQQES
jgi:hypothetical protein